MAAAIVLELASKELSYRHEIILGSRSSSNVSKSGLAFSQQGISSSCGSRERRLLFLVLAPLCLFAGLGAVVPEVGRRHSKGVDELPARLEGQGASRQRRRKEEAAALQVLARTWANWKRLAPSNRTEDEEVQDFLAKFFWTEKLESTPGSLRNHINETIYPMLWFEKLRRVSGEAALFYCSDVGGPEQRFVFIKVQEMLCPEDSDLILAAMYHKDLQCRLINSIGGSVLGYLDFTFPARTKASFYWSQVMEDGGYSATCLVEVGESGSWPCPCPATEERWAYGAFSLKHKAAIVLGALRAVQSMYRKGFLKHGDVKLGNVLLPQNAREMTTVQLADATRLIDHDCAALLFETIKSVKMCSTPAYVPEEIRKLDSAGGLDQDTGKKLLSGMDVFACGMTLFQLVVGMQYDRLFALLGVDWKKEDAFVSLVDDFLHEKAKHQSVYKAGGEEVIPLLRGMLEQNGNKRWDVEQAVEQVHKFCCEGG